MKIKNERIRKHVKETCTFVNRNHKHLKASCVSAPEINQTANQLNKLVN